MARWGSLIPGSCTRISFSPWGTITGSATPNWSTRFRIVSKPWRTADSSMDLASRGFISRRYKNFPSCSRNEATLKFPYWSARTWLKRSLAFASGRTMEIFPSGVRSTWRAGISFLARVSLISLAYLSRALSTAFCVSTSSKRCIPPRRSRPRLIFSVGRNFAHHFGRGSISVGMRKTMERARKATMSPTLHCMLLHMFCSPYGSSKEILRGGGHS